MVLMNYWIRTWKKSSIFNHVYDYLGKEGKYCYSNRKSANSENLVTLLWKLNKTRGDVLVRMGQLIGVFIKLVYTVLFCCISSTNSRNKLCKAMPLLSSHTLRRTSFKWIFSLMTIFCMSGPASCLEISRLNVPPYHVVGEPVVLECHVNLQGDILYSVQWYKNSMEFFRFIPSSEKSMTVFEVPGVMVDQSISSITKVNLRTVTMESSGRYKCEVSADAPSFHTTSKVAEMLVVDLPDELPRLTGGRNKYHVGDEVNVNCTSSKSHPPASLMWYINREQAKMNQLIEHAPIYDEDGLATSQLGLKFIAGLKHFPKGALKLKCTATIAAVYWQSSETNVEGHPSQSGPALESKGVYAGCSLAHRPTILWIIFLLFKI